MGVKVDLGITLSSALEELARVIAQQLQSSTGDVDETAPLFREAAALHDRYGQRYNAADVRNPIDLVATLLAARLFAVADFMRGIGVVAVHGSNRLRTTALAAAPIARALLEALAQIQWLAEPGLEAEERVRRLLVDTVRDHQARLRIVSDARADGLAVPIDADRLGEMCDVYGVEWKRGKVDRDTGIHLPVIAGAPRPPAYDVFRGLMPSVEHSRLGAIFYSQMSDVAHASTQGLLAAAAVSTDGGSLSVGFSRLETLKMVRPVIWAVPTPVLTAFEYLGWEQERFAEAFKSASKRVVGSNASPDGSTPEDAS